MRYQVLPPSARLRPFVRFFWVLEGDVLPDTSYVYRSLADGCAELLFHYGGQFEELTGQQNIPQGFSLIHAQSRQFRRFVTNETFGIFGVYLYPFAIPQLLHVPSFETSDRMLSLDTVLGAEGRELEERVMLAPSNEKRQEIVSLFLEKRLFRTEPRETAVCASIRYLIYSPTLPNVQQLAEKYNLSTRQFERKFKEQAGFSPKLYARIIRFHAALNEYGNRDISLTEIAYQCGYYDQSHFIHDFKAFSGYHPKHYFGGKAEGIEYRES